MKNSSGTLSASGNRPPRLKFGLLSGAGYLLQGLKLLLRPGLRRYLIVPLSVNISIFTLLTWFGVDQFDLLFDRFLPESSWLHYIRWIVWPLLTFALLLILFYSFTAIANLLATPFNGILAAKTELMLTGSSPPDSPDNWVAGVVPGLLSELGKLSYFLIRAVPLLLLFLIPVVQLAAPFLWIAFNAWFFALEYLDYPMSNHGLRFSEQRQWMRKSRMAALGFGGAVAFLMLIPILNFAVMPAAVAGATIFWCSACKISEAELQGRVSEASVWGEG